MRISFGKKRQKQLAPNAEVDEKGSASLSVCETSTSPQINVHQIVESALHLGAAAAVVIVGVKLGIPLLRAAGRLILRRGHSKKPTSEAPIQQNVTNVEQAGAGEDRYQALEAQCPAIPADYKQVASTELTCSVQQFYEQFLAGGATFWQQHSTQVHRQYNYQVKGWRAAPLEPSSYAYAQDGSLLAPLNRSVFEHVLAGVPGSGGFTRTVTFTQPSSPPMTQDAHSVQRQQFAVYAGEVLLFASASSFLNIPWKESFTVNAVIQVRPVAPSASAPAAAPAQPSGQAVASSTGCIATAYVKVDFLRSVPLVGALIRTSTLRDTSRFYTALLAAAAQHARSMAAAAAASGNGAPGGAVSPLQGVAAPSAGSLSASATHQAPAAARGWQSAAGSSRAAAAQQPLAATMPLARQMKVLLVVLLLLGSLLHQAYLQRDLSEIRQLLMVAGLAGVGGAGALGALPYNH